MRYINVDERFIMLGCPNWNKKVDIFNTSYSCDRLNALFEKTNDPEDFLSFAKIQFKVQQDGCTVSKTLIGRSLTKLGFEAKPKKISGRTVVGRTCIKERGEEEWPVMGLVVGGPVRNFLSVTFFPFLKKKRHM